MIDCKHDILFRLLRTYSDKAKNFIQLKETILNHHQKSNQFYEVVVEGDNVRIVRKDEIPKHQLYPKVIFYAQNLEDKILA